jgi:hypothetical protein
LTERKYSVAANGLRIDGFLDATLQNGGIKLTYEIQDAAPSNDDFETPDVMVKFGGADVDLLLHNRAELLLALEHVTMEMLRMPSEDHFLRRQRLPPAAHRGIAAERGGRRRPGEAYGRAFPLQSHEQPGAPGDPPLAAQ